ncbi:MAG: ATP-binding cassette domain-containing protein [Candidatus Aegiribacteria sp.]|nr:ATP-binding cassette domain-containing protein [Candidatus Aegiribacteria sp.]
MKTVIKVNGLTRKFGDFTAVDRIDFEVAGGEIFGFLGPNGAGKTTTVRMLTGVIEPTSGSAMIQDHDIRKESILSREHIAVVPEQANVYLDLSVWRNLMLMAELYGIPKDRRIKEGERLLKALGLLNKKDSKARELSKGLKQRLMLCAALITDPEVLFLDEPTSGLDVQSARLIRKIVRELNDKGLTVFLTTHNMIEAGDICSRVAIINNGRIAAIDTPEKLRSMVSKRHYVEAVFKDQAPPFEKLESLPGVIRLESDQNTLRLYTATPGSVATDLAVLTTELKLEIDQLNTRKPSLEDVFLYYIGDGDEE